MTFSWRAFCIQAATVSVVSVTATLWMLSVEPPAPPIIAPATEWDDLDPHAPAPPEPEPPPPPPVVVGWRVETVPVFTVVPRVTCYSKYSGKVEARGKYSAYWRETHKVLPMSERIIRDDHYTVALPVEYDRYIQELIRLPNGVWTFRWLVHVDSYNWDADKAVGDDAWRFYSVPRDRCPSAGVFDVLFTGDQGAVGRKVEWWKSLPTHQPCTFFEVVPILMYSDGSEALYVP